MITIAKRLSPKVGLDSEDLKNILVTGSTPVKASKLTELTKAVAKARKKSKIVVIANAPDAIPELASLSRYRVGVSIQEAKDLCDVVKGDLRSNSLTGENGHSIILVVDHGEALKEPYIQASINEFIGHSKLGITVILASALTPDLDLEHFNVKLDYKGSDECTVTIGSEISVCT